MLIIIYKKECFNDREITSKNPGMLKHGVLFDGFDVDYIV